LSKQEFKISFPFINPRFFPPPNVLTHFNCWALIKIGNRKRKQIVEIDLIKKRGGYFLPLVNLIEFNKIILLQMAKV
jgi:hypothetical protein